ncbi:MAG: sulfite exporter TauE/SafE family protein [Proteobacteria bacterium]|nr:sulfite exporter TauE/SafE family protein [Pseudomonadota bacterium]
MLGFLFFIVALLYASVGFGGGSSYLALLLLWQVSYAAIPIIALLCNIIVVSGNSVNYLRNGYLRPKLFLPLVISSVPFSYIGGALEIEKDLFVKVLFFALTLSGIRLLVNYRRYDEGSDSYKEMALWLSLTIGSILGLFAGITGIGGGIFLSPILYYFMVGSPKEISATSSIFILINSISGLLGQISKGGFNEIIVSYWYLPLLALIGGQIGNLSAIKFIPARIVAIITSLLILFVATHLAFKIWG